MHAARVWRDKQLDNGMCVQYRYDQDAKGVNVLHRGFWLHLRELDWRNVQAHMEKQFGRPSDADVVMLAELDGSVMIGVK